MLVLSLCSLSQAGKSSSLLLNSSKKLRYYQYSLLYSFTFPVISFYFNGTSRKRYSEESNSQTSGSTWSSMNCSYTAGVHRRNCRWIFPDSRRRQTFLKWGLWNIRLQSVNNVGLYVRRWFLLISLIIFTGFTDGIFVRQSFTYALRHCHDFVFQTILYVC